jgi:mannose-6-phosphate isomerase-like protein (cupin superfamily)
MRMITRSVAFVSIFFVLALLPITALSEEETRTQPAQKSTQQAIDEAKETTNEAIEAAKQAILDAIDRAKEITSSALETEKDAKERALEEAKEAAKTLDQASQAARELLENAKKAAAEVLDKAKEAADSPMKGFVGDIEAVTKANSDYRRVLYTAAQMQLVLMTLQPGEEIGEEVHDDGSQFIRIEKGNGEVWIDGAMTQIRSGMGIVVPGGASHNVKNTGEEPMKLYTLYAPPEHIDGTVQVTKADAEATSDHFDGKTTE